MSGSLHKMIRVQSNIVNGTKRAPVCMRPSAFKGRLEQQGNADLLICFRTLTAKLLLTLSVMSSSMVRGSRWAFSHSSDSCVKLRFFNTSPPLHRFMATDQQAQ